MKWRADRHRFLATAGDARLGPISALEHALRARVVAPSPVPTGRRASQQAGRADEHPRGVMGRISGLLVDQDVPTRPRGRRALTSHVKLALVVRAIVSRASRAGCDVCACSGPAKTPSIGRDNERSFLGHALRRRLNMRRRVTVARRCQQCSACYCEDNGGERHYDENYREQLSAARIRSHCRCPSSRWMRF